MNTAKWFIEFFEASFMKKSDQQNAKKLADDFFADFIFFTPIKLELLQSYLRIGQVNLFYKSLIDLKYLIEFSDNLNRYWHVLRGYSEALSKLKADSSVKSTKRLCSDYFNKYGDRRTIRNEHWFEKKRWEFLDELQSIYTEDELQSFIQKYQLVLEENFKIYVSFMMVFLNELQKLQEVSMCKRIGSGESIL
jgi:hypothetical protein